MTMKNRKIDERLFNKFLSVLKRCESYEDAYNILEKLFQRYKKHSRDYLYGCTCKLCTTRDEIEIELLKYFFEREGL